MNLCYLQALAKKVHEILIKPITARKISLYYAGYLSFFKLVSVRTFLHWHTGSDVF